MMLQLVIDEVPEVYEPPDGSPAQQLKFGIFQGGCSAEELQMAVCTKRAPVERIPAYMPGLKNFIPKCIEKNRNIRLNAMQALKDPFFTGTAGGRGSQMSQGASVRNAPESAPSIFGASSTPSAGVHRLVPDHLMQVRYAVNEIGQKHAGI